MLNRDEEVKLTLTYEALSDDRLIALASKVDELTDIARDVLSAELRRRRLSVLGDREVAQTSSEIDEEPTSDLPPGERRLWYARPGDYAELAAPDCTFPIRDEDNIHEMRVALALAGIPQDEFWPRQGTDLRTPMLAVRPEDCERARAILARPPSADVRKQVQVELAEAPEWQPPSCPKCEAPDALLVSVTPTNTWLCDECGYTWVDVPPSPSE